jgi:hypothetical protein
MSQDLFAAFGSLEEAPSYLPTSNTLDTSKYQQDVPPANLLGTAPGSQQDQLLDDDEDDFGDFEDASAPPPAAATGSGYPPPKPSTQSQPAPKSQAVPEEPKQPPETGRHPFAGHMDLLFAADEDEYDAGKDEMDDLANNPEAAMAYSKRVIAEQQAGPFGKAKAASASQPQPVQQSQAARKPNKLQKKSGYAPAKDPNVLFDAEKLSEGGEDEDDFGDFEDFQGESVASAGPGRQAREEKKPVSQPPPMPAIDLLGLDEPPPSASIHPSGPARQAQKDPVKPSSNNTAFSQPLPTPADDDDWDDFELPPTSETPPASTSKPTTLPSSTRSSISKPTAPKETLLPPTNIPPPSLLLSLFPPLLTTAQSTLLNPLSKLDPKQRQQLISHPATHTFLQKFLRQAVVLAHIIAGRRLRWKRDQFLAQGMRIGAASGARGGMKLAGVDKGETAKEDREVLDAVAAWKGQVGKLRTAVASLNALPANWLPGSSAKKLPPVPEISEQLPVKTLKPLEGGVTAPQACALCGLKREERIVKVDEEVEDSFGEWWVEGMGMHVVCREFWEEEKGRLRSR